MEDKKQIMIDSLKEIQEKIKVYDPDDGKEHNSEDEIKEMEEIISILNEIDDIIDKNN